MSSELEDVRRMTAAMDNLVIALNECATKNEVCERYGINAYALRDCAEAYPDVDKSTCFMQAFLIGVVFERRGPDV